uniref:Pentacotripeptide-repeat region of PRORP domain-containing protein n=1 Tax=Cucumis sativus TaxID=3659 RepID=A0A0A0L668_CUCSA
MKLFSNHSSHGITSMPNNSSFKHSISLSKPSFLYSTWHSPPPLAALADPVLAAVSTAINNAQTKPLASSLRRLLPSFKPHHFIDLINQNPFSLSPSSLFSFFNWLSSIPTFRHTSQSYCAMANFLSAHQMFQECQSIIRFLVSRKGKDSAASVFAAILDTAGTRCSNFVFDALMIAYWDSGFVSDAIQCFRLVRNSNFQIPFHGCGYLLDKMINSNSPVTIWTFYSEILEYGFPPKVQYYNILINKFCKEGSIRDAKLIFNEIRKRGLRPTTVSFNTLINGLCKSRNLDEGFRLKKTMEENRIYPDVFTYSVLIHGLCKEGRLDVAEQLFDEMQQRGLRPNGITFTALIDGQCRSRRIDSAMNTYHQMLTMGVKPDLVMYNTLLNGLCKVGDVNKARKLVDEMRMVGMKPDKITYTTLIDGYCKEGDLESAMEIRKGMNEEGVVLDNVAFTALISGQMKNANMLLEAMLNLGVTPDDITYNILLEGHCKNGKAEDLLKLRNEKGLIVDYAYYTSLVSEYNKSLKDRQKR